MKALLTLPALLLSLAIPVAALSSSTIYLDVPSNHIYAPAITHFTDTGLVSGYGDGSFGPEQDINRVEALKILMDYWQPEAAAEILPVSFTDLETDAWYLDSLESAVSLGIVSGYPDGSFKPEQTVNKAEALKMILLSGGLNFTAQEGENWHAPYMDYAIAEGLITIEDSGTYEPEKTLTRGEFMELLYRMEQNPYQSNTTEYGVASYYSYSMNGVNTASGRALEAYGNMAAHKTLPFGTWIRVTNLANNKYVDVMVVDRGPYTEGRVVDLSPAAFEAIGSLGSGLLNVRIEVLAKDA